MGGFILSMMIIFTGGQCVAASSAPEYASVATRYADLVQHSYAESAKAAMVMQADIRAFLDQPGAETLKTARDGWIRARPSYLHTEAFRFYEGPIDAPQTGPEGRINAWPLNEAFIDGVRDRPQAGLIHDLQIPITRKTISGRDQVSDEADVTTGWHAIEFLLWGQDVDAVGAGNRSWRDYKPGDVVRDRRRHYLMLVTDMLVDDLNILADAWQPQAPYRQQFLSDLDIALTKMLTGIATLSSFEMASERLSVPLDSHSQEDEQSCFSDTTAQDFVHDQQGIEQVYYGLIDGQAGPSLHDLIQSRNPDLATKIQQSITRAHDLVARFHTPFDQIVTAAEDSPLRIIPHQAVQALDQQGAALIEAGHILGLRPEIKAE